MTAPRFSLTERQIKALIEATPPGYVPSVTVSFAPAKGTGHDELREPLNPADLIEP